MKASPTTRALPPDVQLALLASKRPVARGSAPTLASPYATAVLHTPLTSASLVALDPRTRSLRRTSMCHGHFGRGAGGAQRSTEFEIATTPRR
jgi:hypothetical protein